MTYVTKEENGIIGDTFALRVLVVDISIMQDKLGNYPQPIQSMIHDTCYMCITEFNTKIQTSYYRSQHAMQLTLPAGNMHFNSHVHRVHSVGQLPQQGPHMLVDWCRWNTREIAQVRVKSTSMLDFIKVSAVRK